MTKLTPRHYQVDGIDYLTTLNVKEDETAIAVSCARHILSDAPGAGKTLQAILAAIELTREKDQAVCILAPAHLCPQWYQYFLDYFPEYNVVWLEGPAAKRTKESNIKAKFYIMSIQSLRHKHYYDLLINVFTKRQVGCTIVDESHYVKNPDAKTSINVRTLTRPQFCKHVILLSATPVVREADDLYMQLKIVDPFTFRRQDVFLNTYCWFSYGWGGSATNVQLRKGASEALKPWLWGRTYKDIGLELPPVVSYVEQHNMTDQRRKVYDDIKHMWYTKIKTSESDYISANSAMEVMHLLRHITASPEKAESLIQFMKDDPGPYLIATFYKASASMLAAMIPASSTDDAKGYKVSIINGDVPATDRRSVAQAAVGSPNSVIVATIMSISEGVDLSHCNTVYFYEEDYTPGKMYQFLSRVRRHRNALPGSDVVTITEDNKLHIVPDENERPVIVRYFHAAKSIDTHIHAVQNNRAVSVKDIIKVELAL